MSTTIVVINDSRFQLADPRTASDLRTQVEAAVRAGGGFVDLVTAGDRPVAILITPASQVQIATEVALPPLDEEDDVIPYGIHALEDL